MGDQTFVELSLPADVRHELEVLAARAGMTVEEYIAGILRRKADELRGSGSPISGDGR
jgi:hypothetical protein